MPAAVDSEAVAHSLWTSCGLPVEVLTHLKLSGKPDPVVQSSFRIGTAAQVSIGLAGLSAAHFHFLRTGVDQDVHVDARHAALEFKSEVWYSIDGKLPIDSLWDDLAGLYPTKGNGFVRLHTNFPHHRRGVLDILQCAPTKDSVSDALLQWDAVEFETKAAEKKMCVAALRSFEAWDCHPQARVLANAPPVTLIKIGDAPKRISHSEHSMPLNGIKVLDLTRVIAGPTCGRTLAAHGADVLWVTSPNLPSLPFLDADTSRGKRTTQLDLNLGSDRSILASLAEEADVFLQAYRPGGLENKGFGTRDLLKLKPGIVCANLTAWGWDGLWSDRRGFDSLVQTTIGLNDAEAKTYTAYLRSMTANSSSESVPAKPLPMQALDHAAAYLLVLGINAALCKTCTDGGSWEVRVSLAAVGSWIRSLGRLSPAEAFGDAPPLPQRSMPASPELSALNVTVKRCTKSKRPDHQGQAREAEDNETEMIAIGHSAILEKTPVHEGNAPGSLSEHSPVWLSDSGMRHHAHS